MEWMRRQIDLISDQRWSLSLKLVLVSGVLGLWCSVLRTEAEDAR
jgi:hypothetical protein